ILFQRPDDRAQATLVLRKHRMAVQATDEPGLIRVVPLIGEAQCLAPGNVSYPELPRGTPSFVRRKSKVVIIRLAMHTVPILVRTADSWRFTAPSLAANSRGHAKNSRRHRPCQDRAYYSTG